MDNLKLTVFSIFNTVGEYSRVSVNSDLFQALGRNNSSLPYTTSKDKKGNDIKVFVVDGHKLLVRTIIVEGTHTGKDGKEYPNTETWIFMKTEEAKKLQTNVPDAIAQYDLDCE